MTITNGYCTLPEYKAYARVESVNAGDDAVIEDIIESVSRRIDTECKRVFYQVTEARYFTSRSYSILYVDDIATSTGLTIQSQLNSDGTYQYTWASTDYNLLPYSPKSGFPYTHIESSSFGTNSFDMEKKGNKITATWGWSAIPDDLKMVCLSESKAEYERRNMENAGQATVITNAGVTIPPAGWLKTSLEILSRYRKLL